MTIEEYAAKCKVHPNTVRMWALRGLIDVGYEVRGKGQYVYNIPEKAKPPKLRPGPRPMEQVYQEMSMKNVKPINEPLNPDEPPWDQLSVLEDAQGGYTSGES